MADVIGLIASVVNIAQGVTAAIKLARTLYRAQEEFDELQVSIENGVQSVPTAFAN